MSDETSRNHIILGLGGTGGRVIRALRKRIWQLHRPHGIPDVNIEYLYVDSSPEMMGDNDPAWRVLGESVQLPRASRLLIGGARVWDVLENRRAFPSIAPWIGDRKAWAQVPGNVIDAGAGGQRRRLGRFLFAMKAPEFREAIKALAIRLRDKPAGDGSGGRTGGRKLHVHLVTGLAGGTGGGSFLDAMAMLANDREGVGDDVKISLFALLPEQGSLWNDGNYYANGYAALLELNAALLAGARAYRPYDLRGTGERLTLPVDRIGGIYLCSNENRAGATINVQHEAPSMIADFLYERIAESPRQQSPIFSNENRNMGPETVPGTAVGERARRFSAFGIRRVEYPESEIEEYLTQSLVRSAVLALLHNNWSDSFGFLDRPPNASWRDRAEDPALLETWHLADAHLRGEAPVLAQDKRRAEQEGWKPNFEGEWLSDRNYIHEQLEAEKYPAGELLPKFHELMEEGYEKGFRRKGVAAYFRDRLLDRAVIARTMVASLEADLLRRWREGHEGWSLAGIAATIEALRLSLSARRTTRAAALDAARNGLQLAEEHMEEIVADWSRKGLIGRTMGRRQVLADYGEANQTYQRIRTDLAADEFALELVPVVLQELAQLETKVGELRQLFEGALKDALDQIASRLRPAGSAGRTEPDRYFDPAKVMAMAERMARDKNEMGRMAASVQQLLLDTPRIRDSTTFGTILDELRAEALDQRVFQECNRQVARIHDRFAQSDGDRVLGVKLLQRLRNDLGGDRDRMQEFVRRLVDQAQPFLRYDETQRVMSPDAVGAPREAALGQGASAVIVQRPQPPELAAFGQQLDRVFRETGLNISIPEDTTSRPNALTVMSIDTALPARFIATVGFLKQEYLARLRGLNEVARLEVHSEDAAADLPDLFVEPVAPAKANATLLLGRALGLVLEDRDEAGRRQVVLRYVKDGFTYRDRLAGSFDELPDSLAHAEVMRLDEMVSQRLGAPELRHIDDRRKLDRQLVDMVQEVERTSGDGSEAYVRMRDAALKARQLLRLED
ncbi:tubulin-like doman-containing protein [Belnapia rosea]|uniref:Tubulin like n=1 Tax=Belnapia rosea TaxID=938405 RepID=A0A1G6S5K3_9PROT|nr:tubulin-like doman-containing protein [Belnapia rosea]SDD11455.1 Tubulin like [Belnapia rosea]